MKHASIAMSDVQSRRNDVIIPNGGPLHSYANACNTHYNLSQGELSRIASETHDNQ